jgi:outer membrane protein OmpA-like peptidoglycan-associated protein
VINEAMIAFNRQQAADAYRLYREARTLAGPDDLRVLNGLYTTSWKTGRKKEAGRDVRQDRRPRPRRQEAADQDVLQSGNDDAAPVGRPAGAVRGLAAEVATQIGAREGCLRVIGHTSRTGDAAANEVLSQKRAA